MFKLCFVKTLISTLFRCSSGNITKALFSCVIKALSKSRIPAKICRIITF